MLQLAKYQHVYTPDIGVVPAGETVLCGVCGKECEERRNKGGPRSYVETLGKRSPQVDKSPTYDMFICPHDRLEVEEMREQDKFEARLLKALEGRLSLEIAYGKSYLHVNLLWNGKIIADGGDFRS